MTSRALDLLLGTEPKQRLRLVRSLGAAGVYVVCLMMEVAAVSLGMADKFQALRMSIFILLGQAGFYVTLRAGWNLRWSDPALTMPQMVFAMVSLTLAYGINPPVRGMMTMIMALVLVFGAFTLPPRRCSQLSWLSVVALAVVMLQSAIRAPSLFEPRIEVFHFFLSGLVLPVIGKLAGELSKLRAQQQVQKKELRAALEKVHRLATRDELTGLPNRRQILELLAHEERKALRQGAPLCICMIDIDHFKRVNDTLGHQAGDEALQRFSTILSLGLRAGDVLARWGGEEFMLLLPGTSIEDAAEVLERLRKRCDDPAQWLASPHLRVTFSAGLSVHISGEPAQLAIARADAALYQAKKLGRNRVVVG